MPKIIEELRSKLLREARVLLLQEGDVTIRAVASRCHVAVGTVYNYFHSKDELMAYVMLADWQHALHTMQARISAAPTALAALQVIFDELIAFETLYRDAWAAYAKGNDARSAVIERHGMVVGQLVNIIEPVLTAHGALWTDYLPTFLAETLLAATNRRQEDFSVLSPIFARLIQP